MTDAPVAIKGMSMEEFIRRSEQEGPFELIDGEIKPKMPTVFGHNTTAKRIFVALLPFEQQGLGEVFQEATFVLSDSSNWVAGSRIPDVLFVTKARLDAYRESLANWQEKPLILVPDLAIEVVSPNDTYTDINDKVTRYLQDGVRLVLVVDAQVKTIAVHVPGSTQITYLSGYAVLTGGEVIPGFELRLSELFV